QQMRRLALRFQARGLDQHLERDIEGGLRLRARKVIERTRVAIGTLRLRDTKRRQRLRRHHEGRDRGGEALGQERPQRLILPGLDVARRPVVEQAKSSDVLLGLADRDRCAARIAGPDEGAELKLIIEIPRRPEARLCFRAWLALATRALNTRARSDD